jgi:hypothetical protein
MNRLWVMDQIDHINPSMGKWIIGWTSTTWMKLMRQTKTYHMDEVTFMKFTTQIKLQMNENEFHKWKLKTSMKLIKQMIKRNPMDENWNEKN